jgi:hypothetical protein
MRDLGTNDRELGLLANIRRSILGLAARPSTQLMGDSLTSVSPPSAGGMPRNLDNLRRFADADDYVAYLALAPREDRAQQLVGVVWRGRDYRGHQLASVNVGARVVRYVYQLVETPVGWVGPVDSGLFGHGSSRVFVRVELHATLICHPTSPPGAS